jgi:hypothetical protein
MRIALLIIVLSLSLTAGFFFRGSETQSVSVWTVAVLALCVVLADLLGSPTSRNSRIGSAVLAGVLFAGGWYLGGRELEAASADCARRVGEVRSALETFRDDTGNYPDTLNQLEGIELPGRLLLRRDLLEYSRTSDGYLLSYRDGRFVFTATEDREPFIEKQVGD